MMLKQKLNARRYMQKSHYLLVVSSRMTSNNALLHFLYKFDYFVFCFFTFIYMYPCVVFLVSYSSKQIIYFELYVEDTNSLISIRLCLVTNLICVHKLKKHPLVTAMTICIILQVFTSNILCWFHLYIILYDM